MDEYCHAVSAGKQVVVSCLCCRFSLILNPNSFCICVSHISFYLMRQNIHQDDNGLFRNSLNCISAILSETALPLVLLHNVKIHITCIVVFYISLKLTNCKYCSKHNPAEVKLPVTDHL